VLKPEENKSNMRVEMCTLEKAFLDAKKIVKNWYHN